MKHDDEDALAGIDLRAWEVPPPAAADRPAIVLRALSRAAASPARRRLSWLLPAAAVFNAALAAILIIVVITRPAPEPTLTVLPAGSDAVIARLLEQIRKYDEEIRLQQQRLVELTKERALLDDLRKELEDTKAELEDLERQLGDKKARKQPKQPQPIDPPAPTPAVQHPFDPFSNTPAPSGCDEVSCVLDNYVGACCAKFKKGNRPTPRQQNPLPEMLDRSMISAGIARVKSRVAACGDQHPVNGKVKVSVRVSATGKVNNVIVETTPDPALGACVASAVQAATFERTQLGGSFSYPFIF